MDYISYITLGIVILIILIVAIINIIKFLKLSKGEKKRLILSYIKGLVALAEHEIGAGHGAEKLMKVEKFFNTKAPIFYKCLLKSLNKNSLQELIEEALSQIKEDFGGNN